MENPYISHNLSNSDVHFGAHPSTLSRLPSGSGQSYSQLPALNSIKDFSPIESASIPSTSSTQAAEKDINEIIIQCMSLGKHMEGKEAGFFCKTDGENPWLDDMIFKANQILNALLRLRKQQLAANNNDSSHFSHSSPVDQKTKIRKRIKQIKTQGQCQFCKALETPEWRRGPNGARTLCNACGLNYAKLMKNLQQESNTNSK
ncbi:hypothetical protein BY458DRAFT_97476 [Sporodiniella umbellata]|nr:hypothetical protein BY458DRAFT_97476 [Sporodiniella umbellata]